MIYFLKLHLTVLTLQSKADRRQQLAEHRLLVLIGIYQVLSVYYYVHFFLINHYTRTGTFCYCSVGVFLFLFLLHLTQLYFFMMNIFFIYTDGQRGADLFGDMYSVFAPTHNLHSGDLNENGPHRLTLECLCFQ